MKSWLILLFAICLEIIATSSLKAADGFTRLRPTIVVFIGYAASFYCLSLAVRKIPLAVAYALWSGIGTVAIVLIGIYLYKQNLDLAGLCGITLIISGVLVLNLLSKT